LKYLKAASKVSTPSKETQLFFWTTEFLLVLGKFVPATFHLCARGA